MTARFGRNKKRKILLELAESKAREVDLIAKLKNEENRSYKARVELRHAVNMAFTEFAEKTDLYKYAVGEMSYGLGQSLGEELNQHRDKILGMIKPMGHQLLEFQCDKNMEPYQSKVVSVIIPLKELHYRKIVA